MKFEKFDHTKHKSEHLQEICKIKDGKFFISDVKLDGFAVHHDLREWDNYSDRASIHELCHGGNYVAVPSKIEKACNCQIIKTNNKIQIIFN